MLPVANTSYPGRLPIQTFTIIAVTSIIFFITLNSGLDASHEQFGFPSGSSLGHFHTWLTLVTAQFLHADFFHLLGNMWFFWIFAPLLEERLGHLFFLWYIGGGVIAGLGSYVFAPGAIGFSVGASGAIAFLIGLYWNLFPDSKVLSINPMFNLRGGDARYIVELPGWYAIMLWFGLQLLPAVMGWLAGIPDADGVGYSVHIMGVVVGLVAGGIMKRHWSAKPSIVYGEMAGKVGDRPKT